MRDSFNHFCDCHPNTDVMQANQRITSVTAATDRLLEAMADKKMTQEGLATAVGYKSQGAIGNAIARGSLPKKLTAVAAVLGVRAEWIETGMLPKRSGETAQSTAYEGSLTLSQLERDVVFALRVLPIEEQHEFANDLMHRAERLNKAVERLLQDRGLNVSGFTSATRAAEVLPPSPNVAPPSKERRASERRIHDEGMQPTLPMTRRQK